MSRGILIMAAGDPQYGNYAANLCMSIKYSDPNTKVCLAKTVSACTGMSQLLGMFDHVVDIPPNLLVNKLGMQTFVRAKAFMDQLSPFDETIFVDADVIFLPHRYPSNLFDKMAGTHFMMGNRGGVGESNNKFQWAAKDDLLRVHGKEGQRVYDLSSEFVYFDRSDESKRIFDLVRQYIDDPQVPYTHFSGDVPDEVAFNIAILRTEWELKHCPFLPFYWEHFHHKGFRMDQLVSDQGIYGYSMGGSYNTPQQEKIYLDLAKMFARHHGLKYWLGPREKRLFSPLRHKI
jgi:hypothetical protein